MLLVGVTDVPDSLPEVVQEQNADSRLAAMIRICFFIIAGFKLINY